MSTKDIFLSYGREPEVIQFVKQLKRDLERHGFGVWLDVDDGVIDSARGLHQCRALIAIITKKYVNSRFCSSELYTAVSDQKLIFPVIFEKVDGFGASDTGMGISEVNWSMFRPRIDNYGASLYKLIEGLKEKVHQVQRSPVPSSLGTSATPTFEAASSFKATPSASDSVFADGSEQPTKATGVYYCGKYFGVQCLGHTGYCGPNKGPQCPECNIRVLPTRQKGRSGHYYCGRYFGVQPMSSFLQCHDGYCGPTCGPQCPECAAYEQHKT